MPKDLEEMIFSSESEQANDLIKSAMGNLRKRISVAKKLGDKERVEKYTTKLNKVEADYRQFIKNDDFRKQILMEYPSLLAGLDEEGKSYA